MKCPHCSSTNTVRPSAAVDQGSSSHIGIGASTGGATIGVGFSRSLEAKKARSLMAEEAESEVAYMYSLRTHADSIAFLIFILVLLGCFYLLWWVIGIPSDLGSPVANILGAIFWVLFPFVAAIFCVVVCQMKLESVGGKFGNFLNRSQSKSVPIYKSWMCRKCGNSFKV